MNFEKCLQARSENCTWLQVRVSPNASKTQIQGLYGEDRIKILLASPPVDGKANKELQKFLTKIFHLTQRNVEIVSGEKSKSKTIQLDLSLSDTCAFLEPFFS